MTVSVGRLRTCGLAKESAVGTLVTTPAEFLRFIPPDSFYPKITPLISKAVGTLPDAAIKQSPGPGTLNGMKLKLEAEPENIGHLLYAAFGNDGVTGSANAGYSHLFARQAVAVLPTFSFWFDKVPLYPQFAGCMLNKLDFEIKAKEFLIADTEWEGLKYDATGSTHSPSYSTARPFTFNQAVINVDGSPVTGYDNLKISINNMVKADHALSGSIYPAKIYSEGMEVEISADLFFEDATQYNKFLAGTTAHFNLVLTHADNITNSSPGTPYTLTFDFPQVVYKGANLVIPTGVLKVPFVGTVMYDTSSTKTMDVTLKNSVSAAYSA